MKCTRHRCQAAPPRVSPMACLRPTWASLMTSFTFGEPAFHQTAKKGLPEGRLLARTHVQAEDLPFPVTPDPDGHDQGHTHDPAVPHGPSGKSHRATCSVWGVRWAG